MCLVMPFASSISDGILIGVIAYVLIHVGQGKWREVSIGSYLLATAFMLKYAFL